MENIRFSRGLRLSDFSRGIPDIGQFNKEDKKILNSLYKKSILVKYKDYWCYNGLGPLKTFYILEKNVERINIKGKKFIVLKS